MIIIIHVQVAIKSNEKIAEVMKALKCKTLGESFKIDGQSDILAICTLVLVCAVFSSVGVKYKATHERNRLPMPKIIAERPSYVNTCDREKRELNRK